MSTSHARCSGTDLLGLLNGVLVYQVGELQDEWGRDEVCVPPFPGPDGKWQISSGGGDQPCWRSDGKEIYLPVPGGRVTAGEVDGSGDSLQVGRERVLFTHEINTNAWQFFDASFDGQKFQVVTPVRQSTINLLKLVRNLAEALARP